MPLVAPDHFVTDGPWGTGKGVMHTPAEADEIFDILNTDTQTAIAGVAGTGVADISHVNGEIVFTMDDAGPTTYNVGAPILYTKYRGEWQPSFTFNQGNMFKVQGFGLYIALLSHISGATFDPNATVDGFPAYLLIYADNSLGSIVDLAATSYSPVAGEGYIRTLSTLATTIQVDENTNHVIGAEFLVRQAASGSVTIAPENGNVIINFVPGKLNSLLGEGSVVHVKKVAANEWDTWGDYADAP